MEDGSNKYRKRLFVIIYSVTILVFVIYFFFISDHSYKTHHELNRKIDNLENKITSTKNQIGNVYTFEQLHADSNLLEKYAREQLNMHREEEDVFIIVHE